MSSRWDSTSAATFLLCIKTAVIEASLTRDAHASDVSGQRGVPV